MTIQIPWSNLRIPDADFDVDALHSAIDEQRIQRKLSWRMVADLHRINSSTIRGLKSKRYGVEGDGVLQMLLWLDRSPESFVPNHPGASHPSARLPHVEAPQILRFDVPLIYSKLDALRISRGLTWAQVATEIGGVCSAESLRSMHGQVRTSFPQVVRLARWLRCPVAGLTRIADW